jgi:hypothetical protein
VIDRGGTITIADIDIVNTLSVQINASGLRPAIMYLLPFIGSDIAASTVPLIAGQSAATATGIVTTFRSGSPRSIGSPTVGTATGYAGNGTSIALETGLYPWNCPNASGFTAGNVGLGYWSRAVAFTGSATIVCGSNKMASQATDFRYCIDLRATAEFFSWGNVSNRAATAVSATNAHYYGERASQTSRILYKNGSSVATSTANDPCNTTNSMHTIQVLGVFGASDAQNYFKDTAGVFYITDGSLGSSGASAFHTLLNTYLISATGR